MKVATIDRGAVLGAAGRGHLSPAVKDGVPALLAEGETAGRVGWAEFFAAADRAGLAVSWDAEDPSSATLVPAAGASSHAHGGGLAAGIDSARRFVRAFGGIRPGEPRGPGEA